jgi:hypothetical protein
MDQPSLYSICSPENPPEAQKPDHNTKSPFLARWVDRDADELQTHSQTEPYLRNEPTAKVTPRGMDGFFRHVFLQDFTEKAANLDLPDLKYNPEQPRQAEVLLERKLNECIDSSSRSQFIFRYFVPRFAHTFVKISFLPGRYTRRHSDSIVTIAWT